MFLYKIIGKWDLSHSNQPKPKKRRLKPTIQRNQTLHANRLLGSQELTRGEKNIFLEYNVINRVANVVLKIKNNETLITESMRRLKRIDQ